MNWKHIKKYSVLSKRGQEAWKTEQREQRGEIEIP